MNAGESMDAQVLMQKLVERDIDTSLLIEFYEEVVENEKIVRRIPIVPRQSGTVQHKK